MYQVTYETEDGSIETIGTATNKREAIRWAKRLAKDNIFAAVRYLIERDEMTVAFFRCDLESM